MDTTPDRTLSLPLTRRRRVLAGAMGGFAATATLGARGAAGQGGTAPAAGASEIRLGALYPLSGSLSLLGDESLRGLEIAVEERNAAGGLLGRPVRLLKGDAIDGNGAVGEARRLVGAERVSGLFGTFSSALSFAATQVAEMQRVPYFELGAIGDPITERGFRTLFRTCPRASDFAREAVNAVPEVLAPAWGVPPAAISVAILHEDGLYGQSVSASQEALLASRGLRLVEKLPYTARGAELMAATQRLRGAGADVVLHTGYQNDIIVFYRAMRESGWRPRMVIGSGAGYSGVDTMRAVGPDFDGTVNVDFTQFEVNERMAPGVKQFAEAYRRRYGAEPRSGHSLANYCGARICLDAVQRAGGTEADRVRAAMLATDLPDGTTPTGWGARFDERGQNTRARPFVLQWQNGKQVTVFPAEAAVARLRAQFGPAG
jgi:branched-chain amino acid transport system substrate-binding protein